MPMGVPKNPSAPTSLESGIVMELVDVSSEVVVPAMRAVLREGEVSAFELSVTDELEGSVALSLTARGERFHDYVVQGSPVRRAQPASSQPTHSQPSGHIAHKELLHGKTACITPDAPRRGSQLDRHR